MGEPKKIETSCTLKEKIEALEKVESGASLNCVAKEYSVSTQAIRLWKQNKDKLKEEFNETIIRGESFSRRRVKPVQNEVLEECLYEWFKRERDRGMQISGPVITAKALVLNLKTGGNPKFSASQGWLHKWKKRHGIREISVQGEKLSSDLEAVEKGKKEFQVGNNTDNGFGSIRL